MFFELLRDLIFSIVFLEALAFCSLEAGLGMAFVGID
jgi:hypothetical protein